MSRFGEESFETIDAIVENTIPSNTKRSKRSVWEQFLSFCREKNYYFDASTSLNQLASILKDWAFNMKRQDGTDYKESVVKVMWNSTAKQLQEKFFLEFGIKFDAFSDIEFASARAARDAKRRTLQADPSKRKRSSAALSNQELVSMAATWDENTPIGLQRKFFHIAGYELAWRGGEASNCCVHHFIEEFDNKGVATGRFEYNPVFTKTTPGGAKKLANSKWLTMNTDNPEICPYR
jgi:hypothetical protein